MTESEAIKKLKQHFEYLKHAWKPHPDYETMDAIGYAISALETIKKLSDRNMTTEVLENYMQFEDECVKKGFTFKSVIEAREKQIAKKPIPIDYEKYIGVIDNARFLRGAYWCPNCKHVIKSGSFCNDCGQRLDWSDEE